MYNLILISCMNITFVNGNNSWKFHDDAMRETQWKRCDRQAERWTERSVLRAAWSQLKTLDNMHNNDTGLQLLSWEGSSALKRGKTLAIFSFDGKIPLLQRNITYMTQRIPYVIQGCFQKHCIYFFPASSWLFKLQQHFSGSTLTLGNPFAYPGINITRPFCYLCRKCSFWLI